MKRVALLLLFFVCLATTFGQTEKIRRVSFKEDTPTPPTVVSLDGSGSSTNLTAKGASAVTAGLTAGNLSVSATGAAVYTIPISVPPGLQGIVPTLSINYNSQAGNGMAGYGWNVSGVSVITRVGSTIYHDARISAVDFTETDRFAVDGQRLILKTGQYGKDGATYETENFSHLKIKSVGVSPYGASYGPKYFEVLYPDGSKAYYGQTDDSRSHTDYAISYWENLQGVRMTYHYRRLGNTIAIERITYGKVKAIGDNEVRFSYKNRTRPEVAYIGGVRFENTLLLEKIQSFSKGKEFRTYTLNYAGKHNSLGYDRLMEVQESIGTEKRNPIRFEYSETHGSSFSNKESVYNTGGLGNISAENSTAVPLDMNGDRLTDFILYPTKGNDAYKKIYLFDDFRENSNGGFVSGITLEKFSEIFPAQILIGQNDNIFPDYQGFVSVHKYDEKLKFKAYIKGTVAPVYTQYEKEWELPIYYDKDLDWYLEKRQKENIPPGMPRWVWYFNETGKIRRVPVKIVSGDFNGDGLTDVLAIEGAYTYQDCKPKEDSYNNSKPYDPYNPSSFYDYECTSHSGGGYSVYWIDLDKRKTSNFSKSSGSLKKQFSGNDLLYALDVTGDGKTNLIHISKGEIYVYELNNDNSLSFLWKQANTHIKIHLAQPIPGDYNGDKKIDFLLPVADNSNRFVLLSSTGKGFDVSEINLAITYKDSYSEDKERKTNTSFWSLLDPQKVRYRVYHYYRLIPIDINNDGKTDIAQVYSNWAPDRFKDEQKRSTVTIYANIQSANNHNFINVANRSFPYTGILPHFVFSDSHIRDIFMDISMLSGNTITALYLEKNNRKDMSIKSVLQNDIRYDINYKPMTTSFSYDYEIGEISSTYEKGWNEQYPYIDVGNAPSSYLVNKIERTGGGIPAAEQLFKYTGAVSHIQGLGFLGFKSIGRSNWFAKGRASEEGLYTHTRMNPQLRGATVAEFQTEEIANYGTQEPHNYLQKTVYTYDAQTGNDKIFRLKLAQKVSEDKLTGVNTTQVFTYDTDMNPTQVVTTAGTSRSTVQTAYAPKSQAPYLVGRVALQRTSNTIDGDTFTSEEQLTYQNNLVTSKKIKGHNTGFKTERYTYDDVGNITKQEVITENGEIRSEQMEYDTSKRFLKKHTDFEGQVTLYQHNDYDGTLQQETNHFGQTTRYTYDLWGRLTKTTNFLNKSENIIYQATLSDYTIIKSSDDSRYSKEIYNWLGLLTYSEERRHNGSNLAMRYQYDAQGRGIRQSLPHYGTSPKGWIETTYDRYGRVTRVTQPAGKNTQITYNGLSTTVNDGTKTTITTKNASGQTVKQQDPGGIITYTYFGNGNLKTADYQGAIQRITQDGWGRKTALNDPSAGNYTYTYDAWDRITKETTPKGTTTYSYEKGSDRIKEKHVAGSGTDMRTTYTYNADKLLSAVKLTNADGNNENYTYTYNAHKQITSLTENKLGGQQVFVRSYVYDGFGRIERENYTAQGYGKKVSMGIIYSRSAGILTSIRKTSGENIWGLGSVNEYDQPTSFSIGKVTEQFQYDYHYLTAHSVSKGNAVLENKTFQFDRTKGLLNHRTYSFNGDKETFGYDNLERLTSWTETGKPTQTQEYDTRGRIERNNQLGRYRYEGNSYQQTRLNTNPAGNAYYTQNAVPTVTYNAFKSPTEIRIDSPKSKDIISYQYDAFGSRATSYYGGLQPDKMQRRYRKHYSHDGIFEIKHDHTQNKTEFFIYLGGDAYDAPSVFISDGQASKYVYLHRDYLGSITLITDDNGNAVEKRHFNAWGQITKYWNNKGQTTVPAEGILLDRGYTSHEHLLSVGLIHMNGRLYDPVLHRFLQPDNYVQDPFNTQNFNRYGYVLNNPLMYTDPSGEEFVITPLIAIGIGSAIASLGVMIKENWPAIKEWTKKQADSVGQWFEKQYNSIFRVDNSPKTISTTAIQTGNILPMSHLYPQHTNSFEGAFGQTLHFLTGGVENGAIYDQNGNFQSIAPQAGGGAIELINGGIKGSLSLVKSILGTKNSVKVGTTALRQVGSVLESVDDVMANPSLLQGKSYFYVRNMLSKSKGWINDIMRKTRGSDKGWVLRQVNSKGQETGKLIQYHSGSRRHFGGKPYWKVSDGKNTFRFPATD